MDALYVSKPVLPFQKAAYYDDYEHQSYRVQYPDPVTSVSWFSIQLPYWKTAW